MGHDQGKRGAGAAESIHQLVAGTEVIRADRVPPHEGGHHHNQSSRSEMISNLGMEEYKRGRNEGVLMILQS